MKRRVTVEGEEGSYLPAVSLSLLFIGRQLKDEYTCACHYKNEEQRKTLMPVLNK